MVIQASACRNFLHGDEIIVIWRGSQCLAMHKNCVGMRWFLSFFPIHTHQSGRQKMTMGLETVEWELGLAIPGMLEVSFFVEMVMPLIMLILKS
jgi:hypothetical protein